MLLFDFIALLSFLIDIILIFMGFYLNNLALENFEKFVTLCSFSKPPNTRNKLEFLKTVSFMMYYLNVYKVEYSPRVNYNRKLFY